MEYGTKSYTEINGEAPFDWNTALAADCKDMDPSGRRQMRKFSLNWVTCACGAQCHVIPRDIYGMPKDMLLAKLGTTFGLSIRALSHATDITIANMYRLRAVETLGQIEERSATLIAQELDK